MSEIIQNTVNKTVRFKTTVHFSNGSKETIFHVKPPIPDAMRIMHFAIAEDEGVAYNMDDVRKLETKAFVENGVKIIS
jgi:hypothetical protein